MGLTKQVDVETPRVPNFVKVGNEYLPLSDFTDEELRLIGKAWIDALLDRAAVQRKRKTEDEA